MESVSHLDGVLGELGVGSSFVGCFGIVVIMGQCMVDGCSHLVVWLFSSLHSIQPFCWSSSSLFLPNGEVVWFPTPLLVWCHWHSTQHPVVHLIVVFPTPPSGGVVPLAHPDIIHMVRNTVLLFPTQVFGLCQHCWQDGGVGYIVRFWSTQWAKMGLPMLLYGHSYYGSGLSLS